MLIDHNRRLGCVHPSNIRHLRPSLVTLWRDMRVKEIYRDRDAGTAPP
jgi:hypothetical protein